MAHIEWKKIYETGISTIDEQHRNLVGIINKLYVANITGNSKSVVGETLQELLDYTLFHFKEEEELLKYNNYSKFDEHQREHEKFTRKVKKFVEDNKKQQLLLSIKIMDFLKDWTINHILGDDQEYVSHVK